MIVVRFNIPLSQRSTTSTTSTKSTKVAHLHALYAPHDALYALCALHAPLGSVLALERSRRGSRISRPDTRVRSGSRQSSHKAFQRSSQSWRMPGSCLDSRANRGHPNGCGSSRTPACETVPACMRIPRWHRIDICSSSQLHLVAKKDLSFSVPFCAGPTPNNRLLQIKWGHRVETNVRQKPTMPVLRRRRLHVPLR